MKGKLQKFSVKLLASMLAVIMSIPANAFAMVGNISNTYTENTSVMGIQAPEETKEDQVQKSLLKSELSTDESDDYIIKKSAYLSKTTGQIDYIIKIINKTPEKESSDKQTTTFAITQNTDLLDLKVEKVQALDANGNEEEINYTQGTPNAFNSTDNIRSTGITSNKPQNGVVYYLNAKLTDQALKDLEQKSPQLALDFTIASPDNKIYQDRYALEIEKSNTTEITIDNEGNIANPEGRLVENQESLHLYKGEYKEEQKGIFQSTPAQIIWTDYINAKDNKEFTYDINLDQGQDTRESQVKIEYYEAQEKGYVLNESFTKTLAFANNLKLSIPEGYIAKVELNTRPKEDTKEFAYNGIKIPNPTYTEEKNEAKEEHVSDDADPLPNIFSKNDAELNSSNDSITDQKDQNFSTNSKTDPVENLSAIALNKDAYFEKLKADDKLTANIEEATNEIEQILEAYNKEEINRDDFKQSVQNIKNDKEIDESQTKDILASLLIGLNEEKYKVANIDIGQAAGSDSEEKTEETADQAKTEEGKDLSDKTPDELAKAKLAEEGVTIEDFQNYMYELEEKYGFTDEDADRIYTENAEAIQALVNKAQDEKTRPDMFLVDPTRTYPYNIDYWTYQYYDQTKNTVNWDIQIETSQVNLDYLDFDKLGLALYAPEAQGLENFTVTIRDFIGNEISDNKNSLIKTNSVQGNKTYKEKAQFSGPNNHLYTFNTAFSKGGETSTNLPANLFIHVEAKPKTDHAKYQMYELGLRLTPDRNYIQEVYNEFKNDWAKLVAMMPWIIPFKSGDGEVKKFEGGFNVVDTRLPADAMPAAYYDDKYKAKSYTDKSRSVFGEFIGTNTNNVRWQISDTLRLEDDDRFVSSGKLGDDVFNKSFNANNSSGHTNPNIEVLEPKSDGTYDKIFSTTAPTNPSGAEDFRKKLSKVRPVLLPGTIINYTFNNRPANNPSEDSTVTINFSDRFDYEVGTYGGEQTATLRRLSPNEIVDNEKYRVVYGEYKSGDFKNEPNRIDAMIIKSTGDIVYCLNATLSSPAAKEIAKNVKYSKKYEDISGDKLNELISRKTSSQDALIRRLKAIFYTAEYEYKFKNLYISFEWGPGKTKYNVVQAAIYRAIDDYNNGKGLNTAEEMSYYRGFTNGDPYRTFERGVKPRVDSFYTKVKEVEDRLGADLDNLVRLDGYESVMSTSKKAQNVLGPVFTSPFEMDKVDKDDNRLSGIEFNIVDSNGAIVKKWTSSDKPEKIYLKPGVYTLKEVDSKTYKAIKDVKFEIKEEKVPVNKYDYIDFSNKQSGQVTNYKNQLKLALLENDNKDSTFGQLVTLDNDAIKIKVKNIGDTKLEINKKLLGADGKYHELAGIKFNLKEKGILNWTKKEATTNKDGIAVFDNLPLNSQWTLEEVKTEGLSEVFTKWDVSVNSTGKVTITGNKDSRDPDNLFTIDRSDSSKITVINEPDIKELGNFKIKKVDTAGKPLELEKVGFTLYASDKETVIGKTLLNPEGEYFTNDQGELYYSNLPDGIYYLKETSIPDGYIVKDGDPFTTIIIESGKTKLLAGSVDKENFDSIINVSKENTSVTITDGDGVYKNTNTDIYGNIDFTKYDDGTYIVSAPGKTTTITVKDKKVVSFEQDTTNESDITENEEPERAWVSNSNYVAHGGYPDYMNARDYSVVENPNTKQVTTYLMLKPDSDGQKNGTNKDTYLKFEANNSEISEIEFFRAGSGEIKETLRAAMENRNLENYFGTEYIGDTFENDESSPIKMSSHRYGENSYYNPLNTNYVKPDSNNYYISIPKSRFDDDKSYIVKVVTNVRDTNKESSLSYQWASENPYEASLRTQTRNIPALSQMTKNTSISALDKVINKLLPTAYAADVQSDYKDVKITNKATDETSNYILYKIENIKDETDVSFTKYGLKVENGKEVSELLPGAEFKLQKLENREWTDTGKTAVSDNNGKVKFTDLASGKYKVMETKLASTDYRKPKGAVKIFEVKDGKIYVDSEGETAKELDTTNNIIINEKLGKNSIKVNKKNNDGQPLEGVRFGLYNKNLVYLEEGTTDSYGKLEFDNLSFGQYWIKELSPKAGYILDSNYRLVNIGESYEVPSPSQGMDVSNYFTFDKQKTNIVSTSGDENWVYPNDSEGMIAKINLNIEPYKSVKPGDTFRLSFSGNVDFDGISYLDDDNLDIYDANGKIAVAKIEDNRRSVTYTFTEALDNFKLGNIKVSVPLYMNRLQVKNDRNNVPISINVGNRSVTDYINVNYSDYWYEGPDDPVTVRYINSYPYKVNLKDNTFEMIAYVNSGREQTAYKQAYFSFNEPVSDVRIDAYESTPPNNYNLVESYGIDFNRLEGLQPTRITKNYNRNTGEYGVKFDNDYYNQATYLVRIRGKINSKNVSGFKSTSRYYAVNGQYSNGYYSTRQAAFVTWQDYYPATAESNLVPDTTNRNVEITLINNKNNITFTKVSNSELTKSDNNVETKKVLSGATFELRKLGNNNDQYSVVKESVTSNENGKFGWSEIEPGDYEVWETKASKGYITPNKAVATFTVDGGGNITNISSLEIVNDKPTYPSTGGAGTFIGFALIGTAIMLAGIAYFAIFQNDKNRRRSDRYVR